jgi:dolichyl-phosphate-mannose--protein O-mannosyl transferase
MEKKKKKPTTKRKPSLLLTNCLYILMSRQPVPCGAAIRLRHTNTKGYLHSHLHSSPLSGQQEVSCFDGNDGGDDWLVQCVDSSQEFWLREQPIQLVHVDSSTHLTCSPQHQYGQPIPGQLEVATAKSSSKNTHWVAQVNHGSYLEYIYIY